MVLRVFYLKSVQGTVQKQKPFKSAFQSNAPYSHQREHCFFESFYPSPSLPSHKRRFETEKTHGNRREPYSSAMFSTANLTWIGPILNPVSAIRHYRLHGLETSVSIFSLTPPWSTEHLLLGGELRVRETVRAGQNHTPESRFISRFLLLTPVYHHFIDAAYLSTRDLEAHFADLVML
jgi:hypothetical protein